MQIKDAVRALEEAIMVIKKDGQPHQSVVNKYLRYGDIAIKIGYIHDITPHNNQEPTKNEE